MNLFHYRPRKGDIWTFKTPNKRRKTKTVARVSRTWYTLPWSFETGHRALRIPTVHWVRLNKGRYSSIRVKWLLKHGELLKRGLEIDYNYHSGADARRRITARAPAWRRR